MQTLEQLSTAELSDALDACGIEGCLLGIRPLASGMKLVGPVFTVQYLSYEGHDGGEFKTAGNYIDEVPRGHVILIENQGRSDCTTWGDILTQVAIKKGIAGTVVHGAVRDVEFIKKSNYPLFSMATFMRSGKNRVYKSDQQCSLQINGVKINPGDMLVADENGVLVIPLARVDEVVEKASNIKATEQAIIESVLAGNSLEMARKQHRYDQPWLNAEDK